MAKCSKCFILSVLCAQSAFLIWSDFIVIVINLCFCIDCKFRRCIRSVYMVKWPFIDSLWELPSKWGLSHWTNNGSTKYTIFKLTFFSHFFSFLFSLFFLLRRGKCVSSQQIAHRKRYAKNEEEWMGRQLLLSIERKPSRKCRMFLKTWLPES